MNRVMFAGTRSGAGKTTITCGIMQSLIDKGYTVSSFKCGPDYIDPMFHSKVIGTKSCNLDSYFTEPTVLQELLASNSQGSDISIIEGVMGYYDGIGFTDTGSSYSLAALTKTPVILILEAKGMSSSIGAVLKGFLTFKENSNIKGVIFNQLPETLYDNAKKLVEEAGIKSYGYVPVLKEVHIKSRHLGLVTADEIKDIKEIIKRIARELTKTIDLEGILALSKQAKPLNPHNPTTFSQNGRVSIGVAMDEAFCFYYKDNLELLKKMGCTITYFSPLKDKTLPPNIQGILLGGGYPELYAQELSKNSSMKAAIKTALEKGIPTIAECGGFMYLHEGLEDANGNEYPMVGLFSGKCYKTKRLQRFGYIRMEGKKDSLIAIKQESIKAHEFHYWDSENSGSDFHAFKAGGTKEWDCIHATDSLYAGFPHLYFYSNPAMASRFVEKCLHFKL